VNLDDALWSYRGELVTAAARWQRARIRRRRRLVFLTTALAAAGIVVGASIAASGWLVGSPAPRNVKSDFGSYAPQLGFNPEPGKAVLVASGGPYRLYATTNKQGGYCVLVSAPWKRPGPHGEGGDCVSRGQASVPFSAGIGGAAGAPHGGTRIVLDGRTRQVGAARVRFTGPQGERVTTPAGPSGFFIAGFTVRRPARTDVVSGFAPGICRWSTTFVVLDGKGRALAQKKLTFGPRICLRKPNPEVTVEGGTKAFLLGRGAFGYLAHARPGDEVSCRGAGHLLTITIPEAARRRYRRTHDRRLQLDVEHRRDGRIWVMCG
jgi:hypothetical protein